MVLLEAAGEGVAVVTTNTGAVSEIIDNEKGILVKPKDKQAFRNGLEKLIKDKDLRLKLAKNLQDFTLQNFSWDKAADLILQQLP